MEKYWMGEVPGKDDFGAEVKDTFIDGATAMGPWAIMTPASFAEYGVGIGQGRGQKYSRLPDGRWLKVGG